MRTRLALPIGLLFLLLVSACTYGQNPILPPLAALPTGESPATQSPTSSPADAPALVVPADGSRQVLPIIQNAPPDALEEIVASAPGLTLYVDGRLPDGVGAALVLPEWLALTEAPENASLTLTAGTEPAVGHWIYALVAPFPTIPSEVSREDLHKTWNGKKSGPFGGEPLLMSEDTYQLWTSVWGQAESGAVKILPSKDLLATAWERGKSWAIVPFEGLEPRWKVLAVDGESPIRKDFEPQDYPLSLPLTVTGDGLLPGLVQQDFGAESETPLVTGSNRQNDRLTTVALTGVTALVRATAFSMEQRGVNYPAQDIGDLLKGADILHISNEVPFAKNCPFPDPVQPDLKFCSAGKYIELLETIGTDVVELTGDHFADWGQEAMEYTLKLYADHGWPVYGGGETLQAGKNPITLEHHGNKLAFIGCNAKGGGFATASASNPGAVPCDFEFMQKQIRQLADDGYNVIATFQHFEYYTYAAQPNQIADAHRLTEAGAAIVSGSQAHQPQGMEFDAGAFIHHGLGNLFFDQYEVSQATRQGFIDRHVFYAGRYISTELIPIVFVDFARPRLMNDSEAADVLNSVFSASGW